ncbi:hypothetical protein PoB_001229200 [Plakobranchus ocellatus]|uniref:Uncharacterized protein n=1 Tax=Plakobranchus ocellatus TaxID=259542 RepID=A0AAV3YS79_9GAST|nr:hypothetical protein PoB_001229200 [Plakobranchus ocellatus]
MDVDVFFCVRCQKQYYMLLEHELRRSQTSILFGGVFFPHLEQAFLATNVCIEPAALGRSHKGCDCEAKPETRNLNPIKAGSILDVKPVERETKNLSCSLYRECVAKCETRFVHEEKKLRYSLFAGRETYADGAEETKRKTRNT